MLIYTSVVKTAPTRVESVDEALFSRIAQGDKEAFCALYKTCRSAVFAFSLSLLRSTDDADDATQDTFLRIRSAAHLYQPQGKPMAWILTIARNVCLMQLRRRKHDAAMPNEEIMAVDLRQITEREDRIVLETAFAALSQEECRIIMLHVVSGMKHREIAQLLDLPLATVLSKYSRGLAKLRRELEEKL
ncbi:MAG: sigma-70 family RNA polymerase sigma factor [Oscillospiraceae bacterium]|nr:sigma-70 family RNA polymerase sigma factor [Oscillospiraceae bacterium]